MLRRLKTYLRATMKEERLNGLALGHIYKDEELDVEEIIRIFAQAKPRKMALLDWSADKD